MHMFKHMRVNALAGFHGGMRLFTVENGFWVHLTTRKCSATLIAKDKIWEGKKIRRNRLDEVWIVSPRIGIDVACTSVSSSFLIGRLHVRHLAFALYPTSNSQRFLHS